MPLCNPRGGKLLQRPSASGVVEFNVCGVFADD